MIILRTILLFITLLFSQSVIAQGGTTIKASVDKRRILIGEPLQLKIEWYIPSGAVNAFRSIDSIEHFEFLEKPFIDTNSKKGGLTITGVYKLTSFDSGHWLIPAFIISPSVKTDTIPVDVVFSEFDRTQPYHDIKDIIEITPSKKKVAWWWYASGVALLLMLLLLYLLRKKKLHPVSAPKVIVDPYEEAITNLLKLEKERPGAKQYHTSLTDIFRLYVFRKKGILSLQKTTEDLVLQLRSLGLAKEQFDKLSQSLQLSDFVKFAKYIPTHEDDRNGFNEIKNSIMAIEKLESKAVPLGRI